MTYNDDTPETPTLDRHELLLVHPQSGPTPEQLRMLKFWDNLSKVVQRHKHERHETRGLPSGEVVVVRRPS